MTPTQSTTVSTLTGDDSSRPPSRGVGSPPPASSFEQVQRASNIPTLTRSDSNTSNRSGRASSQNRVSAHGFGPSTSKEKDKNRGKARVGIVIGHIHMMAGQWTEALRMLVEHTNIARKLSDSLWHGKGLEGILVCMLLLAWAGIEFSIPSVCFQTVERSRSLHAAKLSVNLPADFRPAEVAYQAAVGRLSTSLPDLLTQILGLYRSGEGSLELLPLVVCEVRVRFCELLAILHAENGELNGSARTRIVERSATRLAAKPSGSGGVNSLSRSTVATTLAEAQPTEDDNLGTADHIQILAGIGGVYSSLGMERKKSLVLKDMVDRLTAALIQARKVGAAEAGIHPAASLSTDTGAESIVDIAAKSGGVNSMVGSIAETYGVALTAGDEDGKQLVRVRTANAACQTFGNDDLKGAVMHSLISFCEASPDPQGVLRTVTSLLRSATANTALDYQLHVDHGMIPKDEQTNLATTVARTVGVSKHLGLVDVLADYWDPFLVRRLDFVAANAARVVVPRSQSGLMGKPAEQSAPANPLLYDPNASRLGAATTARLLMVRNEPVSCLLTLQNPLEVPTEIESISLTTESEQNVKLETQGFLHTTLEPRCFRQVSISVSATNVGDFTITGCLVKIAGCREQHFPIVMLPWAPEPELLVKHHGQSARDAFVPSPDAESAVVTATAIDAMPLLELESVSVAGSSMMLLDGERQQFDVVVRNTSAHTPACIIDVVDRQDVLRLKKAQSDTVKPGIEDGDASVSSKESNDDSTDEHEPAQIASGNTTSFLTLQPGDSTTLHIDLIGKIDVSEVTLDISYQRSPAQGSDVYARILAVPIHLTVDAALQAHLVEVTDAYDQGFVVTFDIQNAWVKPISYCVDVRRGLHGGEDDALSETLLAPGEVHRIAQCFERTAFSGHDQALPDVKQALLKRVKVSWRTWVGEARWGEVDLGRLGFTSADLEMMRERSYTLRLDLIQDHNTPLKPGSFVIVRATMAFEAPHPGPVWLELQSPHDKRNLGLVGVPHGILPTMSAHEEVHVDFSLCPMVSGVFALDAYARPAMQATPGAVKHQEWRTERSLLLRIQ